LRMPGSPEAGDKRFVRPWEDASEKDPEDLRGADVSFTVWIEALCDTEDLASKVRCDFTWFGADGQLSDAVDAGTVQSWVVKDEPAGAPPAAAAPEPVAATPPAGKKDKGGKKSPASDKKPPAPAPPPAEEKPSSADSTAEKKEETPVGPVSARFEKTSPGMQATCAFVRGFPKLALQVRVRFPGKAPPPTDPEAPPADPPDVASEVTLALAPLLVGSRNGAGAVLVEEFAAAVGCDGLQVFKIGVRTSVPILSDKVAAYLNPLVLTLEGVHRLPEEEHHGQRRDRVYGVLHAFGQQFVTDQKGLDRRGGAKFKFHNCFFVGTWRKHELRDYLQTENFTVEIHDRGIPPGLEDKLKSDQEAKKKDADAQPKAKAAPAKDEKKGKKGAKEAPAAEAEEPPAEEKADDAEKNELSTSFGVARFSLGELLSMRRSWPLSLRSTLEPTRGAERDVKTSDTASFRAALFGENSRELLASMTLTHKYAPGHFPNESYISLSAALAVPLHPKPLGVRPPSPSKDQAGSTQGSRPTSKEDETTAAAGLKGTTPPPKTPPGKAKAAAKAPASPKAKAGAPKAGAKAKAGAKGSQQTETPPRTQESAQSDKEPKDKGPPPPPLPYERYSRIVIIAAYRASTLAKRLLTLVREQNIRTMKLDEDEAAALTAIELTQEQRDDPYLDILTGFTVLDRRNRIMVIEGIRDGAMQRVLEVAGVGVQRATRRCKVLYHPGLGFAQRLYADFNLCLKQIKLRQPTLESLLQRPDLYDSRTDQVAADALHSLVEMKRAERLQHLKASKAFPGAAGIAAVETQYGDFITNEELEGGCTDSQSQAGKTSRLQTPLTSKSRGATPDSSRALSPTDALLLAAAAAEELEDSGGEDSVDDLVVPKIRLTMKDPLDCQNHDFVRKISARKAVGPEDQMDKNKARLRARSEENSKAPLRKAVDTSFLAEQQPVYNYSGQKLNTAELQKAHLRAAMAGKESENLWTYSEERNSGLFPMLDYEVTLANVLRAADPDRPKDPREPWCYPKAKERSEFAKPVRDVSEARKDDLRQAWDENLFFQASACHTGIIQGCFDAKTLGTGGHHVIPARRPGLRNLKGHPAPPSTRLELEMARHPEFKQEERMMFGCTNNMGATNPVDKYFRSSCLDGDPKMKSLLFTNRRMPKDLTAKYATRMDMTNVGVAPVSIQLYEDFREEPRNSNHPFQLAASCARPLRVAPLSARGDAAHGGTRRKKIQEETHDSITGSSATATTTLKSASVSKVMPQSAR